jgi:hypothetical protein
MLHPAELKVIQLARQLGAVGQQAANAYNQAQASLPLDDLLTPDRLMSVEGRRSGFGILANMTELNEAHQKMFGQLMPAAMGQMAAAVAELPPERLREYEEGLITSVNRQLASQAEFYRNRERWIAAMQAIFTLFDVSHEDIRFADGELLFDDDDALDRFNQLLATVEEVHQTEVKAMNERVSRLVAANAVLDAMERSGGRP